MLEALKLNCPRLVTLDATFCTQLDSLALTRALTGAPCLDALVLSVCLGLDPVIPPTFNSLSHLSLLDLSYTGLEVACRQHLTSATVLPLSCVAVLSFSYFRFQGSKGGVQHWLQVTFIAKLRLLIPLYAALKVACQQHFPPVVILVYSDVPLINASMHLASVLLCCQIQLAYTKE